MASSRSVRASLLMPSRNLLASISETVPFCVWMVSRYPEQYEAALWHTAKVGGDRDTTCAIVGGIIASGSHEIPAEWLKRRQSLPVTISPS